MGGDVELALAVRRLVVATEEYRARQARELLGISPTEMTALGILHADGPRTVSDLSRALAMTPASATELAGRLERAGLIERGPHPSDRRKRLLHSTPGAANVMSGMFERMGQLVDATAETPRSRPAVLAFLVAAADALRAAARSSEAMRKAPIGF